MKINKASVALSVAVTLFSMGQISGLLRNHNAGLAAGSYSYNAAQLGPVAAPAAKIGVCTILKWLGISVAGATISGFGFAAGWDGYNALKEGLAGGCEPPTQLPIQFTVTSTLPAPTAPAPAPTAPGDR